MTDPIHDEMDILSREIEAGVSLLRRKELLQASSLIYSPVIVLPEGETGAQRSHERYHTKTCRFFLYCDVFSIDAGSRRISSF